MPPAPEAKASPFTLPNAVICVGVLLFAVGVVALWQTGEMHWLSMGTLFFFGGVSWKRGWLL